LSNLNGNPLAIIALSTVLSIAQFRQTARPLPNVKRTSHNECTKSNDKARTEVYKTKEGIIFRLTLEELGHPQPRTPVHCDNATTAGIANNTVKRQRSRSMEMRYCWVGDKEAQDIYKITPGKRILLTTKASTT